MRLLGPFVVTLAIAGCASRDSETARRVQPASASAAQHSTKLDFGDRFLGACDERKPAPPAALVPPARQSCSTTAATTATPVLALTASR